MAIQVQGDNGTVLGVGGAAFKAAHVHLKPIEYGALGHYRATVKVILSPDQAANSRLFELRNAHAANLVIPTRLTVTALPVGPVATPYLFEMACFRCSSFTAVDDTSTSTATVAALKSSGMSPAGAQVRYLTAAGAAAGMTGGSLTKTTLPMASLIAWMASASATSMPVTREWLRHVDEHPPVYGQNEGLVIENVLAGPAVANAVLVTVDCSWAEATAY